MVSFGAPQPTAESIYVPEATFFIPEPPSGPAPAYARGKSGARAAAAQAKDEAAQSDAE